MSEQHDRGQLDWLVEVAGASAPATATAFAAIMLAPAYGWPSGAAMLVGFGVTFVAAFSAMRVIPAETRRLVLPEFEQAVLFEDVLLLDEVLLLDDVLLLNDALIDDELTLDVPYASPDELLLDQPYLQIVDLAPVASLLLDDPPVATPLDSRVVQLFAGGRMPTAGQLQRRIDRHLAEGEQPAAAATDASDALGEALAELRRTLRQA